MTTAYVNTVPRERQPAYPGGLALERRLNAMIRWNAMVMVLRAGRHSSGGGHIATYQSAAVLYDVDFDHFFRGRTDTFDGDMVYIQGHSAPGIYGRTGPVVVATDYMKIVGDQIRAFVDGRRFVSLGTDGFGRSDTRDALRAFFEVDRHFILIAALTALADDGAIPRAKAGEAIRRYGIDIDKVDPASV